MNDTGFEQQARWNEMGKDRTRAISDRPDQFIVSQSPHAHRLANADLERFLSPIAGRKVLELGCGRGEFAIFLAKQEAEIVGIDVGQELITACQAAAIVNEVDCTFLQSSAVRLPLESGQFDTVVGVAFLHHLLEEDLNSTLRECSRVLKPGGEALFIEPVENSKWFDLLQNLVPRGVAGTPHHRPSLLQRRAWRKYQEELDERSLTNRELMSAAGGQFDSVSILSYGFLVRLQKLLGKRSREHLMRIDEFLFRIFPSLKHLCKVVLVRYRKS